MMTLRCVKLICPYNLSIYVIKALGITAQAGLAMHGNPSRLRLALDRLLNQGGNFTVTFVGGSITVGETPDGSGLSMPQ